MATRLHDAAGSTVSVQAPRGWNRIQTNERQRSLVRTSVVLLPIIPPIVSCHSTIAMGKAIEKLRTLLCGFVNLVWPLLIIQFGPTYVVDAVYCFRWVLPFSLLGILVFLVPCRFFPPRPVAKFCGAQRVERLGRSERWGEGPLPSVAAVSDLPFPQVH